MIIDMTPEERDIFYSNALPLATKYEITNVKEDEDGLILDIIARIPVAKDYIECQLNVTK